MCFSVWHATGKGVLLMKTTLLKFGMPISKLLYFSSDFLLQEAWSLGETSPFSPSCRCPHLNLGRFIEAARFTGYFLISCIFLSGKRDSIHWNLFLQNISHSSPCQQIRLSVRRNFFTVGGGETLAQVIQRGGGCPIPGSIPGQVGQNSEPHDLVGDVSAHCREVELHDF